MKKFLTKIISVMLLVIICISASGCDLFSFNENKGTGYIGNLPDSTEISGTVSFPTSDPSRPLLNRVDAVAKVERAIVAIKMTSTSGTSYGSGVIVDIDSESRGQNEYYILTCHHVIDAKGNVDVYLPDENCRNVGDDDYDEDYAFKGVIGSQRPSSTDAITLVGGDKDSDVAVLRLKASSSLEIEQVKTPIESYSPKRGEDVFAIGNPSGLLPMSVCAGVISYLDRPSVINGVGHMNLIQIDAPINHGSSGGALFNLYGELIGITNAGSDTYNSLNYAIPYYGDSGFISVSKQLIATATEDNYGYITGRWSLGFSLDPDYTGEGVKVGTIETDGNAYESGLRRGDVITSVTYPVDGKDVTYQATASTFPSIYYEMKRQLILGQYVIFSIANRGDLRITLSNEKQEIFCDTGFYPTSAEQAA